MEVRLLSAELLTGPSCGNEQALCYNHFPEQSAFFIRDDVDVLQS